MIPNILFMPSGAVTCHNVSALITGKKRLFFSPSLSFCPYVRNILSCQSASLVNSSAQQLCWLPLGREANKQMWTVREREKERKSCEGRWGEKSQTWFLFLISPPQLTGWMKGGKKIQAAVRGTGSAQRQLNGSHCGERTIKGQGPQMPNTSTAGHSLKGNPPLTNPPCTLTNTRIHSKKRKKKESIVFRTFRFCLEKPLRLKISFFWFSSFPFLFWFNGSPSLQLHKKDRQVRKRRLPTSHSSSVVLWSRWNYGQGSDIVSTQRSS